jgi:hypothetical protein
MLVFDIKTNKDNLCNSTGNYLALENFFFRRNKPGTQKTTK